MTEWSKYLTPPFVCHIFGDVGSGKSVTMASIADFFRSDLDVYLVADSELAALFPDWVHRVNPERIRIPPNSLTLIDDAHLFYYAREWGSKQSKALDMMARQRRKGGARSFVYTTQQGRVLDINLISMASCLIFKRPSMLQLEVERKEIKSMFRKADKALSSRGYKVNEAYVIYGEGEEVVNVSMPSWWSEDISEGKTKYHNPSRGGVIANMFRAVGRATR